MENDLYKNYTSMAVLSDTEEELFSKWGQLYFTKRILPHFPKEKDIQILEIGCGYGRYLVALSKLGYQNNFGIDISEEQIAFAKNQLNLKNVERADALDFLTTHQDKYDVILLLDVIEHLDLDYAISLLKKIYHSLSENGRVIIQVPNAITPLSPNYYGDVTHLKLYSPRTMAQLLKTSGFTTFEQFELPPIAHGLKSTIRRILWSTLLKTSIKAYLLVANGDHAGNIYTSNFLTVGVK